MEPPRTGLGLTGRGKESSKLNSVLDPRRMRRIIAEDSEWTLAVVPSLAELSLDNIVKNFAKKPLLLELSDHDQAEVLRALPTDVPLAVTAPLIDDEEYWKRCCRSRWPVCDVSRHGGRWKRMYFERHIANVLELFVPDSSPTSFKPVVEQLTLAADFVENIDVQQLLPPIKELPPQRGPNRSQTPASRLEVKEVLRDDGDDDDGDASLESSDVDTSHLDVSIVLRSLPRLRELRLTYGVRDCGMNFAWSLFRFSRTDCERLSAGIQRCACLRVLCLERSQVTDQLIRPLVAKILNHPGLEELSVAHNKIGDRGARAFGKLLVSPCPLRRLDISDNVIGGQGAAAIGHALGKNDRLEELSLRLNRIGEEGGSAVCRALSKNKSLRRLNMASCELTEGTCSALSDALVKNKTLHQIDVSSNNLRAAGGKLLHEGLSENGTLVTMDMRLTNVGEESLQCILQIVEKNRTMAARS